eukprot:CAMPEP_0197033970 /NCGR_PEP_ID=MMETSP1384-20130603/12221_1 /TAXON_ID=29189 /ORGANISM="Ammonia sp." /LENGTH=368 /DNA_ID=CAMNT_0042463837 /DNA_START=20 /DNA_END=1126 /DNA_ORIENTATION=+
MAHAQRMHAVGVLCILLSTFSNVCFAGCPFAAMMNSYNFSGDWSFLVSSESTEAYVMHMCHFENHEIYFTLARNNTPDALIGFGAGNWSQTSMMIGGQVWKINNGSSVSHGFGIGMNMEAHTWWIQDPFRSAALHEGTKSTTFDRRVCAIPYGTNERRTYFEQFWDAKRKFHRSQRVKKRVRDRERKRKLRAEKKKPAYVKYYEQLLDWIGWAESDDAVSVSDDEDLDEKFVYEEAPSFPNIYGQTWVNKEDEIEFTMVDESHGCFNGELLSNISIAHYGVAVNSYIEKAVGIRNGQFFVQLDQNELMGSSVTFTMDENGQMVEEEIKQFILSPSDTFIPCAAANEKAGTDGKTRKCDSTAEGSKCEL